MNRKGSILLAAAVTMVGLLAGPARADNVFTLQSNLLQYNPTPYNSNASITYTNPPTLVYGTGMTQNLSAPNDVETKPDGNGGIEVTMTYPDAPGTVVLGGADHGQLVLATWNSSQGVANLNLAGFTNYRLQFTNLDPDGGAYIQPAIIIGPNWQWVQGDPNNGGTGSIGNYNDPNDPTNGASSFLMDWNLSSDPGTTAGADNLSQDANWATDITDVRQILLTFFTPNNIVPPDRMAHFDIDPVPILPGDTNGDGVIDATDLSNLAAHYGSQTVLYGEYTVGDLNHDGLVTADDAALMMLDAARYQASLNNAVVPEPASLSLLALGGVILLRRRRE